MRASSFSDGEVEAAVFWCWRRMAKRPVLSRTKCDGVEDRTKSEIKDDVVLMHRSMRLVCRAHGCVTNER